MNIAPKLVSEMHCFFTLNTDTALPFSFLRMPCDHPAIAVKSASQRPERNLLKTKKASFGAVLFLLIAILIPDGSQLHKCSAASQSHHGHFSAFGVIRLCSYSCSNPSAFLSVAETHLGSSRIV